MKSRNQQVDGLRGITSINDSILSFDLQIFRTLFG